MKTRNTIIIPRLYKGEFPFAAEQLSAFSRAHGMFVISLKDRSIIRYETDDPETFYQWLIKNKVRDVDV